MQCQLVSTHASTVSCIRLLSRLKLKLHGKAHRENTAIREAGYTHLASSCCSKQLWHTIVAHNCASKAAGSGFHKRKMQHLLQRQDGRILALPHRVAPTLHPPDHTTTNNTRTEGLVRLSKPEAHTMTQPREQQRAHSK
jgi:hypothetical protein